MEGKPWLWELETAGQPVSAVRKLGEMNAGTQLTVPLSMRLLVAVVIAAIIVIITIIATVCAHSQACSHVMCQPAPWYMWRSEDRLTEPFFSPVSVAGVLGLELSAQDCTGSTFPHGDHLTIPCRIAQEEPFPTGTISPFLAFSFRVVQDLSPDNVPLIFGVALPTLVNTL